MKKWIRIAIALSSLFLISALSMAQDSAGTEFWLAFEKNVDRSGSRLLLITGDTVTTGRVEVPALGFEMPFGVTPGSITTVELPHDIQVESSDQIEDLGIHVTSDREISIYGLNRIRFTTDAFLAFPLDSLDREHIILSYSSPGSQFAVVGPQDNTRVTITPSDDAGSRLAGVSFDIVLNRGQVYQLRSSNSGADLTGTIVTSSAPVSVFAGHECVNIPNDFNYCDHLIDQMPPTSAWGREHVTMPLASRGGGDTFRFLAAVNNTRITVNGQLLATLRRGEFHEEIVDVPMHITSNQPILVAQYSNGNTFDLDENPNGDPFMMLIPPFEQFLGGYTLTTPSEGFRENFINVLVATNAVGTVFLDGARIPAGTFSPIGDSGFSGAQVPIALGTHNLSGSSPFGAFIYGFGPDDSYGYPGGQSLSPVAQAEDLRFIAASSQSTLGQQLCVQARVTDGGGLPLQGIRADFTVAGANPTSGFVFSDTNGICEFCYTGMIPGTDLITVAISSLTAETTVDWVSADGCVEGPETLCLGRDGRFRVQVLWRDLNGNGGLAPAESIGKRDSGLFYFFNSDNIEMLIKVLDACDLANFNSFWVFYAATTNVEFTVTVTDTVAGEVKEYFNPLGTVALPVQDTKAFQTCP